MAAATSVAAGLPGAALAPPAHDAPAPVEGVGDVRVDFGAPTGRTRTPELLGVSQVPEDPSVADAVADGPVETVRVDAYLERGVHPSTDVYDLSAVRDRLATAQRAEAEVVLILSYMPAWMADCQGQDPRSPTRCPPADLAEWRELVERTVTVAADEGVRRFEVWNEPDNPLFFQGSLADYLEMYGAAARAVEDVEADRGVDLQVGGPAAVGPDPVYIQGLLEGAAARDLPLDFVSWHWYANSPFVGDFDHEQLPRGTPGILDQESPALDPRHYRAYTEMIRSWVTAARLQGLASDPGIWLTEWNVNAGDDPRHRNHEGAAFAAASLTQMEQAELDRAYYFNAQGASWGMFASDGAPRPVREAFDLVDDVPASLVEADPGAHRDRLHVLAGAGGGEGGGVLANFHGSQPRPVAAELTVEAPPGDLAAVDAVTAPSADVDVTTLDGEGETRRYRVELPAQSLVRLAWS
jgi:hypothetical protein